MNAKSVSPLLGILQTRDDSLLEAWMKAHADSRTSRKDLIKQTEVRDQAHKFLDALRSAADKGGGTDINAPAWDEARDAAAEASSKGIRDDAKLRDAIRLAVRRRATAWTGKKPVVEVSIIRV